MIQPVLKDIVITGNPDIHGQLEFTETEDIGDDFYLSGTACIGTKDGVDIISGSRYFIVNRLDFEMIRRHTDENLD